MVGIQYQRHKNNITQAELANRLGISQANVSQWESGEVLPRSDKLPLLAKALNCTIDELYDSGTESA